MENNILDKVEGYFVALKEQFGDNIFIDDVPLSEESEEPVV